MLGDRTVNAHTNDVTIWLKGRLTIEGP
jgi:hypothetical protein